MEVAKLIRTAITETRRILRQTRKPRRMEYNEISKITGAGIIIIGAIGFLIFIIAQLLRNANLR